MIPDKAINSLQVTHKWIFQPSSIISVSCISFHELCAKWSQDWINIINFCFDSESKRNFLYRMVISDTIYSQYWRCILSFLVLFWRYSFVILLVFSMHSEIGYKVCTRVLAHADSTRPNTKTGDTHKAYNKIQYRIMCLYLQDLVCPKLRLQIGLKQDKGQSNNL